jgi:hypothetical protein
MHGSAIANDQVSFCILLQRQVVLSKKEKRLGVENFKLFKETDGICAREILCLS